MGFNPLDYAAAFLSPKYLSGAADFVGHIPFAFALLDMLQPRTLVELGTHTGDAYCAFCQAVAEFGLPTRCHALHNAQPDAILNRLRAYHDPLYGSFSTLRPSSPDAALANFP